MHKTLNSHNSIDMLATSATMMAYLRWMTRQLCRIDPCWAELTYGFGNVFPHNFVWGSCVCFCIPRLLPRRRVQPSFTHNFVTHHLSHTQLCHTPSITHNCAPSLTHTTLSHTINHTQLCHKQLCHTQLCHTQLRHTLSFTHNFVTHNIVTHTTLSHTIDPLDHIHLRFAWQAWRLATSTFVSRGWRGAWAHPSFVFRARHGTCGTGLGLVACLVVVNRP